MSEKDNREKEEEKPIVAKTAVDIQRLKLMKLMKNPDKPVVLPERPKPKSTPSVPEFVRNVMGSSAGAGSGEFHVYRHLRRKEYARQKFIQEKGQKEMLDAEYHKKLEENKRLAEEATAKRRAKRLRKKQKLRERKKLKGANRTKNQQIQISDHSNTEENESDEHDECTSKYDSKDDSKDENKDERKGVIKDESKDENNDASKNESKDVNKDESKGMDNPCESTCTDGTNDNSNNCNKSIELLSTVTNNKNGDAS